MPLNLHLFIFPNSTIYSFLTASFYYYSIKCLKNFWLWDSMFKRNDDRARKMQFHYRHIGAPRKVSISTVRYRGTSRYQRREKGANDSWPTWLELRKFRSTAATPSRKSKYRLQTRKSIPARNIYRQRVTPVTKSFRRNNEVFPGKIGSRACEFLSFHRTHFRSIFLSDCTDAIAASAHLNRASERNIPRVSKQILHRLTGVDLTRRNEFGPRSLFGDGYTLHFPCEWTRPRPIVLRKIFITLIKIYHNDAYVWCLTFIYAAILSDARKL